ncbi:MAG: D-glycerate dehydrogenase [Halobacteriovoraceae bacterium]|nr:D-glycerate dehydrogenase [Halobacteriovoraceae bacterium]
MKVLITCELPDTLTELLDKEQINYDILSNYINAADEYQAMVCINTDLIDDTFLSTHKKLKLIANYAVGYNNIDLIAAKKYDVFVTNTPDVLTTATADLAFTLMLAIARKIPAAMNNAKNGQWKKWEPRGFLGQDLRGKTLGILGLGRIGQSFAKLCRDSFGMNIIYHNRSASAYEYELKASRVEFEELLRESDVLSLHCPLTKETHNIINERSFELMKNNAILINTSRGGLISTDDLLKAIKDNQISGVGLDVTMPEPLEASHELYSFENVLIVPHIGSATHFARSEMARICADNIIHFSKGKPLITAVEI